MSEWVKVPEPYHRRRLLIFVRCGQFWRGAAVQVYHFQVQWQRRRNYLLRVLMKNFETLLMLMLMLMLM